MTENVIYCYSGTGNCLDMAKKIAKGMGGADIVLMRKAPAVTDATDYRRVGFVVPCYGGGLPGGVEDYVKSIRIAPNAYKFGVIQFAGYMGCGLHKIDKIVGLDYWNTLPMQSSAIWLMPHWLCFPPKTVKMALRGLEKKAAKIAADAKAEVKSAKQPPKRTLFAIESAGFKNVNKLLNKGMRVNDDCIGCGTCAQLCPKGNIEIRDGKAHVGKNCIACMTCVQYCPKQAINVGKITVKRDRYQNPNVTRSELTESVIHI